MTVDNTNLTKINELLEMVMIKKRVIEEMIKINQLKSDIDIKTYAAKNLEEEIRLKQLKIDNCAQSEEEEIYPDRD